jgi:hypothetical protein
MRRCYYGERSESRGDVPRFLSMANLLADCDHLCVSSPAAIIALVCSLDHLSQHDSSCGSIA